MMRWIWDNIVLLLVLSAFVLGVANYRDLRHWFGSGAAHAPAHVAGLENRAAVPAGGEGAGEAAHPGRHEGAPAGAPGRAELPAAVTEAGRRRVEPAVPDLPPPGAAIAGAQEHDASSEPAAGEPPAAPPTSASPAASEPVRHGSPQIPSSAAAQPGTDDAEGTAVSRSRHAVGNGDSAGAPTPEAAIPPAHGEDSAPAVTGSPQVGSRGEPESAQPAAVPGIAEHGASAPAQQLPQRPQEAPGAAPSGPSEQPVSAEHGRDGAASDEGVRRLWSEAGGHLARWDWEAAVQTLERLVKQAPDDARAWSALGRARLMLGDRSAALDAWERAAEAAAAHGEMWLFGNLVRQIGRHDPDRALALMDRTRRLRP